MEINSENSVWYALDCETTGLCPAYDKLLSISTIGCIQDSKGLNGPYQVKDHFFKQFKQVPSKIEQLTGLNREILLEKSGNRTLEDQILDIEYLLYTDANIIIHNANAFDEKTIINNVTRLGERIPKFGKVINTLTLSRERWSRRTGEIENHKLGTCFRKMAEEQHRSVSLYDNLFTRICASSGLNAAAQAHTSSYDAFMTLMLARYLMSCKNA